MSYSKVEIWNQAISHLGEGKEVQSENEASGEAAACRRYYDLALKSTLRGFTWPFATKFAALSLVEELEGDEDEWAYSYQYPSDGLLIRRVLSGDRTDNRQSIVEYKIVGDKVYTDLEDAWIEYTFYESNHGKYPDDFVLALSFKLALLIARRLGAEENVIQDIRGSYMFALSEAKSQAATEEHSDEEDTSEFERARG